MNNFYEYIDQVQNTSAKPILVPVQLNKQLIKMELDTGAACTLISKETWGRLESHV